MSLPTKRNGWLLVHADNEQNAIVDDVTESLMDPSSVRETQELALDVKDLLPYRRPEMQEPLNLTVPKGKIFALLGPAWKGKNALLECILGLDRPHEGEVRVFGQIVGTTGPSVLTPSVGYASSEDVGYHRSTIDDTLRFFGRLHGMAETLIEERIGILVEKLDLSDGPLQPLCEDAYRVSIAAAVIHSPSLLILEEPSQLDSLEKETIWVFLAELNRMEGTSILVMTEDIGTAERADIVGYMRGGRMLIQNSPQRLLENFRCETLEESFHKLCLADSKERTKNSPQKAKANDTMEFRLPKIQSSEKDFEAEPEKDYEGGPENNSEATSGLRRFVAHEVVHRDPCERSGWLRKISNSTRRITLLVGRYERDKADWKVPIYMLVFLIPFICGSIRASARPFGLFVAVVNSDLHPHLSESLLESLPKYTIVKLPHSDLDEALANMKQKKVVGIIRIGHNFSAELQTRLSNNSDTDGSPIDIEIDYIDREIGYFLKKNLEESFANLFGKLRTTNNTNSSSDECPLRVRDPVHGDLALDDYRSVLPGFELLSCYLVTLALTIVFLTHDLRDGNFRPYYVAGVTPLEVVISRVLWLRFILYPYLVFALFFVFVLYPQKSSLTFVVLAIIVESLKGILTGWACASTVLFYERLAPMARCIPHLMLVVYVWTRFENFHERFLSLPRTPRSVGNEVFIGKYPVGAFLRLLDGGVEESEHPIDLTIRWPKLDILLLIMSSKAYEGCVYALSVLLFRWLNRDIISEEH